MTDMTATLTQNVQVRRHNGQNPYGDWLAVADKSVPAWVAGLIADEIAEHDADEGQVEQGGSVWVWRKS